MASLITDWRPEDPVFWQQTDKRIAWRTLTITTISLVFAFATCFEASRRPVKFPLKTNLNTNWQQWNRDRSELQP